MQGDGPEFKALAPPCFNLTGFLPAPLPLHILPFFSRDYSLIGSLWIPPILYEQRSLPVHAKYLSLLLPPFVSALPSADASLCTVIAK